MFFYLYLCKLMTNRRFNSFRVCISSYLIYIYNILTDDLFNLKVYLLRNTTQRLKTAIESK